MEDDVIQQPRNEIKHKKATDDMKNEKWRMYIVRSLHTSGLMHTRLFTFDRRKAGEVRSHIASNPNVIKAWVEPSIVGHLFGVGQHTYDVSNVKKSTDECVLCEANEVRHRGITDPDGNKKDLCCHCFESVMKSRLKSIRGESDE